MNKNISPDKEDCSEDNCLLFEERVQELLDQRISPLSDCKVAQHAAQCPECTRMLQSFWVLSQSYDERVASEFANLSQGSAALPRKSSPLKSSRTISKFKKIVWGFGPSFVALLFVCVAIFLSNRNSPDRELSHHFSTNRHFHMVAAKAGSDIEEMEPFSNRVVSDVKSYSYSLCEIAYATKDWTNPNGKMPRKMIRCISKPLTPIRTYVPTEVTIIAQLRHYVQGAWRLLNLSLGYSDEGEPENLGWQPLYLPDSNVA